MTLGFGGGFERGANASDDNRGHLRSGFFSRLCRGGPASISRLTDSANVSRQAITKHLRALEDAGLVRSGVVGRERIWELQTRRLTQVRRYLDQISDQWDGTLQRLRAFVENEEP